MSTENSVSQLEQRIIELQDENKRLRETVAHLTRRLYGSSSQKIAALGIEAQMSLFNEAKIESKDNVPEPTLDDVVSYRKKELALQLRPKRATASAGVYTLIETAKANGLNPTKYIGYSLKDIPGLAFMEYPELLEKYMPWDPLVQKFYK